MNPSSPTVDADRPQPIAVSNRRRGGWPATLVRALVVLVVWSGLLAAVGLFTVYTVMARDLPRIDGFDDATASTITRFFAADGQLVGEWSEERRLEASWDEFPRGLVLAFLAAEDERFFEHSGVDLKGVLRAMVKNLRAGSAQEGASTITQQLAKTLVGSQRSYVRKVKEAILARRMEDLYDKPQILTWYMNVIYLGHGSYGVRAASQNYFRKRLDQLTLGEMGLIAAMAQSPGRVNAWIDLPGTRRRMGHVLRNMQRLGWATAAEVDAAMTEEIATYPLRDRLGDHTPYYTAAVLGDVARRYTPPPEVKPKAVAGDEANDADRRRPSGPKGGDEELGDDALDAKPSDVSPEEKRAQEKRRADRRRLKAGGDEKSTDGTTAAGRSGTQATPDAAETKEEPAPRRSWLARGLTVFMTVDPAMQREATDALNRGLEEVAKWQGYRGALGTMTREAFLKRNAEYAENAAKSWVGNRVLARVKAVEKTELTVTLDATTDAVMHRSTTRWAIPFTVLGRNRDAKVSFKGRLNDMQTAFKEGDIVWVEVIQRTDKKTSNTAAPFEVELLPVPQVEGALISYGVETGGVDAMVGGWDFDRSEVNRVESVRQTGSIMKPIVYAKAYDLGLSPSSLFSGAPYRDGEYNPTGVKGKDDMLVWDALAQSINSISLRVQNYVLKQTTPEDYRAWGRQLGLDNPLTGFTSEILGANQTPTSMSRAFGTFARQGRAPQMHRIRKVVDATGTVLERHITPLDPHAGFGDSLLALWTLALHPPAQQIPRDTAYLMARNLTEVVKRGTATKAKALKRDAAGKTGTLAFDVWFNGFTADRVATVWVGANRMERPVGLSVKDNKVYGSSGALPIWVDFMRAVHGDAPDRPVGQAMPPGVVAASIDPKTGLLAREGGTVVLHREGTEPTDYGVTLESPAADVTDVETDF